MCVFYFLVYAHKDFKGTALKVFSVSEQRDVVTGAAKIVCGRAGSN